MIGREEAYLIPHSIEDIKFFMKRCLYKSSILPEPSRSSDLDGNTIGRLSSEGRIEWYTKTIEQYRKELAKHKGDYVLRVIITQAIIPFTIDETQTHDDVFYNYRDKRFHYDAIHGSFTSESELDRHNRRMFK